MPNKVRIMIDLSLSLDEINTSSSINMHKSFENNVFSFPIKELYIIKTDTFQIIMKERFDLSTTAFNNIPYFQFFKYKIDNIKESLISFDSFYSKETLVQFLNLPQSKLCIIGYFKAHINSFLAKTLLIHLLIAFINFQNKIEDKLIQCYQEVFSKCFCFPLINNFSKIFNIIMKKQELNLVNIKYKTFYLIDLSSNSILFNLNAFHNKKHIQIEKNDGIWKEILYHSHNLMMEYNAKNKKKYNAFYSSEYCVKLECRATYPRYIFIIKFLPVLHGISLVHVYLQKKLSHVSEGNESENKTYKEYDVIYGTEQKKFERNIEFKYIEPLKIKRIEQFFVNYFMTTSSSLSFYYAENFELKYFDSFLLKQISQIIKKEDEFLINKINAVFYQELIELSKQRNEEINKQEANEELNAINFIDFLYFSKEKFLKYFCKPERDKLKSIMQNNLNTEVHGNILENSKYFANEISLTDFGISENKSNLAKMKSIFMLDITGIQKINDVTEDNISNLYPTRTKEIELNDRCSMNERNQLNNDNNDENKQANWNVSNVPHDKELPFEHLHLI